MPDPVTLEFLASQVKRLLDDNRDARAERLEARRTMLQLLELMHRIERRFDDLRNDVSVSVAFEVGNAMLRFEERLDRIENPT